jgi:hypothetical protein
VRGVELLGSAKICAYEDAKLMTASYLLEWKISPSTMSSRVRLVEEVTRTCIVREQRSSGRLLPFTKDLATPIAEKY